MCILKEKMDMVLDKGKDASLLFIRLILAYGFYEPMMGKWSDIGAVAKWFGEDLGLPFPLLNAYMAASTEALGVALLTLGLGVRFISLPLMVIMVVAISTVHLSNGFSAGENGFEIPLYYMLMLFVLATHGGGKYGIDGLFTKKSCEN
ncbi:DoxX family protein [Sulfuricurvum sp.]|uniref:HvfX family Cu-binding RiPP maturation protein n=1 Tax=Sulfuricurvum sp. TaxID=2025608 RepID=UPI003BB56D3D